MKDSDKKLIKRQYDHVWSLPRGNAHRLSDVRGQFREAARQTGMLFERPMRQCLHKDIQSSQDAQYCDAESAVCSSSEVVR